MKRREFMLLLSAAMTAGRGLRAQQKAMPVIGELSSYSLPQTSATWFAARSTRE
jgi:hypothetical protein